MTSEVFPNKMDDEDSNITTEIMVKEEKEIKKERKIRHKKTLHDIHV